LCEIDAALRKALPQRATGGESSERVWQLSPEPLLTGGLPLVPLALISAVTEAELPAIIERPKQINRRRLANLNCSARCDVQQWEADGDE
jgi:hypothetical protein